MKDCDHQEKETILPSKWKSQWTRESKHVLAILLLGSMLINLIMARAESIEFIDYGEEKLLNGVAMGLV